MRIDRRLLQVAVTQQHLDGAQVRPGFEQVRGEAMAEDVGVQRFGDTGAIGGMAAGVPDRVHADRVIAAVPETSGEQLQRGLAPQTAEVLVDGGEQPLGKHHVTVSAALAAANVDRHTLAVDIGKL